MSASCLDTHTHIKAALSVSHRAMAPVAQRVVVRHDARGGSTRYAMGSSPRPGHAST